jgi:chemotaxis protein methyltransferase CheR
VNLDFGFTPKYVLNEEDFRLLRDFIAEYSGIHFDDGNRYLLERRLQNRIEAHSMDSFRDYYLHLIYSPNREEEVGTLLDILTTNETYFFREMNQLRVFSEEIIPEMAAVRGAERKIRVWSAGCSTGEEPYTLSIMMLENHHLLGWQKEIFASDISHRVLHSAREGIYGKLAFRATSPDMVERHFQKIDENRFRLKEMARSLVTFGHLNIMQHTTWPADGSFDIVFCRNVLIYFDNTAKKRAVANLEAKLRPGGFLLLGHAESLLNISTSFVLRHFKYDMVYQKPPAPAGR